LGTCPGRWRTLARGTDVIGGGLTTWGRQVFDGQLIGVGFREDGTSGALAPAVAGPTGALVLGGDHWLPDPQRGPFSWASVGLLGCCVMMITTRIRSGIVLLRVRLGWSLLLRSVVGLR